MTFLDPSLLRIAPCENVALLYKSFLTEHYLDDNPHVENDKSSNLSQVLAELADPVDAVRKRMAEEVETLFNKNGERTLVLGCMHHNASRDFKQSDTSINSLLPQIFLQNGEDHSHRSAVTVDLRYSPDECVGLQLEDGRSLYAGVYKFDDIPSDGPDFARRHCENVSHLDDFIYVKRINKIYAERLPFLDKGPLEDEGSNIPFFHAIHRLLGNEGIFAFDFMPIIDMADSKGDSVWVLKIPPYNKKVSQQEIEDYVQNSQFSSYFSKLKSGVQAMPPIDCHAHPNCPATPCPSLISQLAASAIAYQAKKEAANHYVTDFRAKMSQREKVVLTKEEFAIKIGTQIFTLDEIKERSDLPIDKFERCVILVKFRADRTFDEMCSVLYQMECYQVLNLDPSKLVDISPTVKEEFDKACTLLVEKVVFPQLKKLNFERVAFDPNGQNPENKRPYERVIYVKKITS